MKERGLVFGQKCVALLAKYDQDTRSLRMYQCSLFGEEQELLQTLPKSGTIVNGKLSEQTKWELGTEERESGLWRTPDANMERGKRSYKNMKSRIDRGMPLNLNDQLNAIEKGLLKEPKMFPTPTTADTWTDKLKSSQQKEGSMHSVNLSQAVHMEKMFPTPTSSDHKGWSKGHKRAEDPTNRLDFAVEPDKGVGGTLNPMWVEWLMGFPIGWTDLED